MAAPIDRSILADIHFTHTVMQYTFLDFHLSQWRVVTYATVIRVR